MLYITLCLLELTLYNLQQTARGTMAFQEKKSLVFITTVILIFGYFWLNVFSKHPAASVSAESLLQFWGSAFLRWMGIQITANIVAHIIFSIINTIITKEHGIPKCVTATIDVEGEHSHIIGVLRDGFPVYGNRGDNGITVKNADLDECSGHVGATPEFPEGLYHYHLTDDEAPYSIDCYKGNVDASTGDSEGGPGGPDAGDHLTFQKLLQNSR